MTANRGRVLMAMSGGVDSSVAAILLLEQGYELVGITMKVWDYSQSGGTKQETGCCSLDAINDARLLAVKLGFPHYVVDLREPFKEHIISGFIDEYMNGRTPNPCVLCNSFIKWDALLKKADQLNCDFIATGHYANIRKENNRYLLARGIDPKKDQSYMLWMLSQQNLARTILPLGNYTKHDTRLIAEKYGFLFLTEKRESFEICFIPDNDYRAFLTRNVKNIENVAGEGPFLNSDDQVVGYHKGYPFYTIGQRKGLNIAMGEPVYVYKIDPESNSIYVGTKDKLLSDELWLKNVNTIKYDKIPEDVQLTIKIRYHDKGSSCKVVMDNGRLKVVFDHAVSAITPGQSAVLYEGDDVVAGGIID
ncbi:MAG: tRNA 2-thiouridine(34) synthase MnmA [Bacteroidales bacterium]|nr:tRNA 2-thiouridine(34) synthase MnmA [Bacteroidales bacterium]